MAPRNRASRPNGGRTRFSRSTATGQPLRIIRRGRPRRRDREVRSAQPAGAATGEHGVARIRNANGRILRPGTGMPWPKLVADNYSGIDHRRVVRAENQHGRDAVIKDLQVGRRRRLHDIDGERHGDPRRASRPRTCSRLRPRSQGDSKRCPQRRRDRRRRRGSWRPSRSTSTTSTPPSRNSTPVTSPAKRPPTRTRGPSSQLLMPVSTGASSPRRRQTG